MWIAAFFLVCFGAAAIKPEGKSKATMTISGLIWGSLLCAAALVCSIIDVFQDGGYASWMMLGIVVIVTGLALFFRILTMLKRKKS